MKTKHKAYSKKQRHQYYLRNKKYFQEHGRKWRLANPNYSHAWELKTRLRMSYFEYLVKYKLQKGCCAICSKWEKALCVDHNHATGKIRGLLCRSCNLSLVVIENLNFRAACQKYLEQYRE